MSYLVAGEASAAGDAVLAAGEAALSVGDGVSFGVLLLQPTAANARAARHEIPTIRAVRRRSIRRFYMAAAQVVMKRHL